MASIILLNVGHVVTYDGEQQRCIDGLNCTKRFSIPHVAIIAKGNIIDGIEAKE